ncbi:exo-alpha-sialidase [Oryzihumus leptocrescens]|uniref:exo-alpha-sialidase n=1 Tax=Oryzihumus leptocrescens TaxID=297536 RepID=UPI00114D656B|nr:exo-alpha-sialidase [Oryzihumus leptocrescens]
MFTTTSWTSPDDGATWSSPRLGTLTTTTPMRFVYFHRSLVVGLHGDLLTTVYGCDEHSQRYRTLLARSVDGGLNWRISALIADEGTSNEGRSEPTMVRASNGDLVAVIRQAAPVNPAVCAGSRQGASLVITRSTNDGATWSTPVPLPGAGLSPDNASSADPQLQMMPTGAMVLSYGRPWTRLLVSEDGTGRSWSDLALTDQGISSGYTSIVPLDARRVLLVGDKGSNWCFAKDSGAHQVGVWTKSVELRPSDTRRIDLQSRYLNGTLPVTTDMSDETSSESGPAAVFDGSVDPDAGAVAPGRTGTFTIDLGGTNVLTGASLALPDAGQSAALDLSNDGQTWRTVAGWVSAGNYAYLTDRGFAAASARFARVRVTSPNGPTRLAELELRTNASTFEDDLVGHAPQGFVTLPAGLPRVAVVGGGAGISSERAVRLNDISSKEYPVMAMGLPAKTTRNLELALRSNRVASAFLISLDGRKGTAYQRALHLGVFPDGSLRRWTGTKWVNLSGAGLVKSTGWAGVRINATTSGANVYVNGRLFSRVPLTPGTTAFTGIQVSSGGTAPVGDDMFIDQWRAS